MNTTGFSESRAAGRRHLIDAGAPGLPLGPAGGDPLDLDVASLAAVQCVAAAGAEEHIGARAAAACPAGSMPTRFSAVPLRSLTVTESAPPNAPTSTSSMPAVSVGTPSTQRVSDAHPPLAVIANPSLRSPTGEIWSV